MDVRLRVLFLTTVFVLCGCASTLDLDGALTIAPYRVEDGGRIIVDLKVNNQGPFFFALDTGASISTVFDKLRTKLKLEPVPDKTVSIHSLFSAGRFPLVTVGQMQLGNEIWIAPRIASLPGDTSASTTIDGVLGIDFMRRYAIGFSSAERILHLYPPNLVSERSYSGWASIPLKSRRIGKTGAALYFFYIEIEGQRIAALFDLGAGENLINWSAAELLGLDRLSRRRYERLSGALENTAIVGRFKVDQIMTANIRWRNEEFFVGDLDIFSLLQSPDMPLVILGSGLFHQRDFIIDFVRNRLLVRISMNEVDEPR